ncbi:Oligouridylate-binding protein 1 [Vitis vinifera]|uniref:Oligouridylate-binding protein 1 n=1 Tax=Vitis vinifera TaxID=29760 RepID=A0A438C328_VITVI|nr:Oligouridylate-binding protein 1 [Vitis vinifera]
MAVRGGRYGDLSLHCLLEGVEACYRDEDLVRWSKGREEGKGLQGVLAEKLHHLGVVSSMEVRKMVYPAKVRSTSKELTEDGTVANLVKKDLGVIGEAVWLQPRESDVQIREEHLSRCLVRGGRGGFGGALLLFDFDVSSEAKMVARGSRRLRERVLHMVKWTPEFVARDVEGSTRADKGIGIGVQPLQFASVEVLFFNRRDMVIEVANCYGATIGRGLGSQGRSMRSTTGDGRVLGEVHVIGGLFSSKDQEPSSSKALMVSGFNFGPSPRKVNKKGGPTFKVNFEKAKDLLGLHKGSGVLARSLAYGRGSCKGVGVERGLKEGVGGRDEEMVSPLDMDSRCVMEGEDRGSLPSEFVKLGNFVGMLVVGFEREIISLLKNLEARKSRGVKNLGDKRKPPSSWGSFSIVGSPARVYLALLGIIPLFLQSSYGFVDYLDRASASLAIMTLHGRQVYGQALKVNWAYASGQREDTSGHFNIFVGDLSPEVTDATLYACFSVFASCS